MRTGFRVLDAMTRRPIHVKENCSVSECSSLMESEHVGSVLVQKKDKLLGIVTEQDIVRRVVAKDLSAKKTSVSSIMTTSFATIHPDKDLYDAIVLMRDRDIRTLPVMTNSKLVGIITVKDILKIEPDLFDLLVDKWHIREEEHKPVFGSAKSWIVED